MKKGIILFTILLLSLSLNAFIDKDVPSSGSRDVIEVNPDEFVLDVLYGSSSYNEFTITNIGTGTVDYNMGINYINGYGWVSLSTYSGALGEDDNHIIGMTVNTSNLSVGYFESEIEITFDGDEIIIPIYLTVLESAIESDPEEFVFEMMPNVIVNEEFTITNISSGTFDYIIDVDYTNGYGWINLDTISGDLLENESDTIEFSVNTSGLSIGDYESDIVISYEGTEHIIPIFLSVYTVDSNENTIAFVNELSGNFPNPFNPTTTISYSLATGNNVTLEIFNSKGQRVKTLVNEHQAAGRFLVIWNGTDEDNKTASSGLYFYKLSAGSLIQTKKMILLK